MISSIFLVMALQQQSQAPLVQSVTTGHNADAAARQREHRVAPGDTLSSIAPAMGESWPQLYADNQSVIGADPNLIYVGEVLHAGTGTRPAADHASSAPVHPASAGKTWGVSYGYPNYCGDGDGDGWDEPCSAPVHQHVQQPAQSLAQSAPRTVSFTGSGSVQQCIIARESGGNSQVFNASGHYGLYQFSYSTWVGSGGNGADFGHASVAEQNQVFASAVAARGYSDWRPYDGC